MLILSRKTGEALLIDGDIEVTVLEIQGDRVRIGINAPADVPILRREIAETAGENAEAARALPVDELMNLNNFMKKNKN